MKKISLLLLIFTACQNPDKQKTEDKVLQAVKVAQVAQLTFHENIQSTGMLSSKNEIKLAFKTGGVIKRCHVEEGQYVKAGQLLAELDLSEIDAQVNQAQIGYEKAKRDFERVEKLFQDQAATRTLLNDAKSGLDIAQQTLDAAKFNLKLSKIYAPVSGRILMKLAEQGELIAPLHPMFIMGSGEQAYTVKVGLTDRDLVKVAPRDPAEIRLDAYPEEVFTGKVRQIAQMITPTTGTYEVEIDLAPVNKRLVSGFVARVNIKTKNMTETLAIPVEALVNAQADKADVYLVNNGKAERRQIQIGKLYGNSVAIKGGLKLGETIITHGSGFVSNGDSVLVP
ncbi:efflux transporter, RND family, MFP subunit [Leadbetterella byssophila DSM 17132]|uniref:Efflux transporter, RND family, MFP subunit n=1 Tax=Leadbetterella byssophila (strain DSM 17132 / JCM 16389 / KACC 11308 / NBRC 106382 / 4M15) TaxID=649349 RepID=E4RQE2_LEAB4|nr:efflux RND transporter periplasmic adaptor subunit [Leadbetterella byssophila]ADQ18350.1 efflux transporter, RND family, MFP subunit [Leadbetterella byssophila DSM 17132]